ncbi:MAG: hypothetical protein Pars2KO_27830 [Parasphingorhabdus sp.]
MKRLMKISVFCTGVLTLVGAAQAQTLAEMQQQMESNFKKSDTDKNGKLTQKEAKDGGMWRVSMGFSRIDIQKRGYVTLPQLKRIATKRYQK